MFTRRDRALLRELHNEVASLNDRIATLLCFVAQVPSSGAMVGDEFMIKDKPAPTPGPGYPPKPPPPPPHPPHHHHHHHHPHKPPHHPELIAYISARLNPATQRRIGMALTATLGQKVNLVIDGHSAVNGAVIPSGSTVAIVSNDATVATAADVPPLTADAMELISAVTLLTAGSTDFTVTVTSPDGSVFTAADSLIVNPVAVPGLTHISATLTLAP